MSAKDRPISKATNKNFSDNFDRIFSKKEVPIGEDTRPKDRIKRGLSSACVEEEWDCTKSHDKSKK
tara:strand:- start:1506 stop:1703 length:198 start_codon:yes stop_codon:yes gene_type:complete